AGSTPSARTTGRSWRSATPTTTAGWCRNAAAPDPGPLGDGGFADRAAGAGACDGDRLAGEHREEVAFTRLQVPVLAALHVGKELVALQGIGIVWVALVVRVVRPPLRFDVELHRAPRAGSYEHVAESLGFQAVAPDEDEPALRIDADRRPPHEHLVAEGRAPLVVAVGVEPGNLLAAVDHEVEVLADGLDIGVQGEVTSPHADVDRPVLHDHERCGAVAQGLHHLTVGVVAAAGAAHLEARVEGGDEAGSLGLRDLRSPGVGAAARLLRPGHEDAAGDRRAHPR